MWTKDPLAHNSIEKDFALNGSDCFLMNNSDQNVWVEYRTDAPKLFGDPWDTAVSYKQQFGGYMGHLLLHGCLCWSLGNTSR